MADEQGGQYLGAAVASVMQDSALAPLLSPEATAIAGIVSDVVTRIAGQSLGDMGESAIASLAPELVDTAAEIVGDVAQAFPVLGAAIKGVASIVSALQGADAQDAADQAAWCANALRAAPLPVFSRDVTPADMFARYYVPGPDGAMREALPDAIARMPAVSSGGVLGRDQLYPPAIGRGLIWITESRPTVRDPATGVALPEAGDATMNGLRPFTDELHAQTLIYRAAVPSDGRVMIPEKARSQFAAIRRAIVACHGRFDGGASLWPLWLDLMRVQLETGKMTHGYAIGLLALWDGQCNGAELLSLADSMFLMFSRWHFTVYPQITQDIEARDSFLASVASGHVRAATGAAIAARLGAGKKAAKPIRLNLGNVGRRAAIKARLAKWGISVPSNADAAWWARAAAAVGL